MALCLLSPNPHTHNKYRTKSASIWIFENSNSRLCWPSKCKIQVMLVSSGHALITPKRKFQSILCVAAIGTFSISYSESQISKKNLWYGHYFYDAAGIVPLGNGNKRSQSSSVTLTAEDWLMPSELTGCAQGCGLTLVFVLNNWYPGWPHATVTLWTCFWVLMDALPDPPTITLNRLWLAAVLITGHHHQPTSLRRLCRLKMFFFFNVLSD